MQREAAAEEKSADTQTKQPNNSDNFAAQMKSFLGERFFMGRNSDEKKMDKKKKKDKKKKDKKKKDKKYTKERTQYGNSNSGPAEDDSRRREAESRRYVVEDRDYMSKEIERDFQRQLEAQKLSLTLGRNYFLATQHAQGMMTSSSEDKKRQRE